MKRKSPDHERLVAYFKACKMPMLQVGALRGIEYVGFANVRSTIYISNGGKLREGHSLEDSHRMNPTDADLYIRAARKHKESLEVQNGEGA